MLKSNNLRSLFSPNKLSFIIMNSKKKIIILSAGLILVALNIFAFYMIKEGIGIAEALKNAKSKQAINSLEQKRIWSDILPSLVFTIDIAIIFFVLYLLIKMVFKSLKKSTPTK